MANQDNLADYLKERISQPHWHTAIRLYGLHLLEQSDSPDIWKEALGQVEAAQSLFLESVVFAHNSRFLLDKIWPLLEQEDGHLLRILLARFLHAATFPNLARAKVFETLGGGVGTYARTTLRIPHALYWPPMLKFLHGHLDHAVDLAPEHVARICQLWLQHAKDDWPSSREAAELALAVGKNVYARRKRGWQYRRDEQDKIGYQAALSAAGVFPDEVAELSLLACSRRLPDDDTAPEEVAPGEPATATATPKRVPAHLRGRRMRRPWPDGPKAGVDDAFQEACLHTSALVPLTLTRPEVAREVILALLIEEPKPVPTPDEARFAAFNDDLGLQFLPGFAPRTWFRGPFLTFLFASPEHGLETVIRLVEFATERWAEQARRVTGSEPPTVDVSLDKEIRTLLGDFRVFYWFRGAAWHDDIVASALMAVEKWLYMQIDKGECLDEVLGNILARTHSAALAGLLCEVGRYKPELFQNVLLPLLEVPEFYLWENSFRSQGMGKLWRMGILRETEFDRKQAQKWEEMPHREEALLDIATRAFVFEDSLSSFFEAAKEKMAARLDEGIEDEQLDALVRVLVARFEKGNYRLVKLENSNTGVQFVPPPEMRERSKEIQDKHGREVLAAAFPFNCRQLLDGVSSLEESDLERFWKTMQILSDERASEEAGPGPEDYLAGGIAVLVKHHRKWLRAHPKREEWCVATLKSIVTNPSEQLPFDVPSRIGGLWWDDFAAEALPVLWAENPESPDMCEMAIILVTGQHYSAVGSLMRSTFGLREQLASRFEQLLNVLLRWAVIRDQLPRENTFLEPRMSFEEADNWVAKEISDMVSGKTSPALPDWCNAAIAKGAILVANRRSSWDSQEKGALAKYPAIDLQLVQHGLDGILLPDQARDKDELERFCTLWEQMLECVLSSLKPYDKNGTLLPGSHTSEARLPYPSEYWVLHRTVDVIAQLGPAGEAEKFWVPILSLGPKGHHWIDVFLSSWFTAGISSCTPVVFGRQWEAMLGFVSSEVAWTTEPKRGWADVRRCWCELLGFGGRVHVPSYWTDMHQHVVERLKVYYEKWCKEHLWEDHDAKDFLAWLRNPAAGRIRLNALTWLQEYAEQAEDDCWDDLGNDLAELLDVCWDHHRKQLESEPVGESAFKRLLQSLANRQVPMAMDLQDRIAQ